MSDTLFLQLQTVIVLIVASYLVWRRITQCLHAWSVLAEKELPSRIMEMKNAGVTNASGFFPDGMQKLASKVYVAIIKCDKCGAVKTLREES